MADVPDMDLFQQQVSDSIGSSPPKAPDALAGSKATTAAGLLLGGLGTLFKISAELQQGEAAKQAHDLSAQYAERAAADAVQRGLSRDLQVTMRGSAAVAAQRVQESASGADVNTGGANAAQQATLAITAVDRATVQRNAALDAYGLRARAQQEYQAGENAEAEARSAAIGTFLSGIASTVAAVAPIAAGAA